MTQMTLPDSPSPAPERLLRDLRPALEPRSGAQARIRQQLRAQMRGPALLTQAREALTPRPSLLATLWSRIARSIDPVAHLSLWDRLGVSLSPAADLRSALWQRFSPRLHPEYAHVAASRPIKWIAAFAVVMVAVRASPLLFLAPASIAESPVTLIAKDGGAEILIESLWQPFRGELALHSAINLATRQNKASIIDHDDAVFRLAPHTQVSFLDLTDRPERSTQETTLALQQGELWVLGLVPKQVRAVTVLTAQGRILVHEGSVSVALQGDDVVVRVLDRGATVERHGKQIALVSGDQLVLSHDSDLLATKMEPDVYQSAWVAENLSRDAAHQREIAQLQQERRAASAGILPGSTLYPVKRLAEQVDVLLSLSSDERARKLITQGNTRLNEAAALLQTGGTTEAASALKEYKDTMLQVASGSGGSPSVQSLIQLEVVEAGAATVAAALPGDASYALKQAVDDTIESLPSDTIVKPDIQGDALLDQLSAVKRQVAAGDTDVARQKLTELSHSLSSLMATDSLALVSPEVRQEAQAAAEQVAAAVQAPVMGITLSLGVPAKEVITPEHPARILSLTTPRPLTPEQVAAKAQEIRGRIFAFGTKKAQYDTLQDQLSILQHFPDRGSILRELAKVLPGNGLAQRVRREIMMVSQQVKQEVTASGGVTTTP